MEKTKKRAATLSIISNFVIIVLKFIVGIVSGSISIISEAIHSVSDFLASVLTFIAVSKSSYPADKDHPFGHGKYEDMSGFIEGGLIVFAGLFIIYESVKKIILGVSMNSEPLLGIGVMAFAIVANLAVSRYLYKVAKKTDSVSLYADAEHLYTDVYSSLGVLLGLVLIKITGIAILDPLVALIIALVIIKAGYKISKETLNNLLDGSLPMEDINKIEEILNSNTSISGFKDIKSRKSGPYKAVEVVIFFRDELTICECHSICDDIEIEIHKFYPSANIVIHTEPASKMG